MYNAVKAQVEMERGHTIREVRFHGIDTKPEEEYFAGQFALYSGDIYELMRHAMTDILQSFRC